MMARSLSVAVVIATSAGCIVPRSAGYGFTAAPLGAGGADVGLALGHDLMGASGFTAALWADYGSAVVDWRVLQTLKLFGAGSVYRNGQAPDLGFWPPGAAGAAQGYTLAAGLEWKVNGALAFKLQGDRYAQIGAAVPGAVNVSLNVLSARVVVTPFDWAPGKGW